MNFHVFHVPSHHIIPPPPPNKQTKHDNNQHQSPRNEDCDDEKAIHRAWAQAQNPTLSVVEQSNDHSQVPVPCTGSTRSLPSMSQPTLNLDCLDWPTWHILPDSTEKLNTVECNGNTKYKQKVRLCLLLDMWQQPRKGASLWGWGSWGRNSVASEFTHAGF